MVTLLTGVHVCINGVKIDSMQTMIIVSIASDKTAVSQVF